jgi:hypothetical protein
MAAPQTAYERLAEFVKQRTDWYLPADARTKNVRALRHIALTSTLGYFLIFIAVQDPIDAAKTTWQGQIKPEFRATAETPDEFLEGTFEECARYLDRQARQLVEKHERSQELRDFAEAHKGWKFHDGEGQGYAGRVFDYGKHGQVLLSIQLNHMPRAPFVAQVTLQFSAGPEESITGTLVEVSDWVADKEKCLSLPLRLAECKTAEAAAEMVVKAPSGHLGFLAFLLEFEGPISDMHRWLIDQFAPKQARRRA